MRARQRSSGQELEIPGRQAAPDFVDTGEPTHTLRNEDAVSLGVEESDITFGPQAIDVAVSIFEVKVPVIEPSDDQFSIFDGAAVERGQISPHSLQCVVRLLEVVRSILGAGRRANRRKSIHLSEGISAASFDRGNVDLILDLVGGDKDIASPRTEGKDPERDHRQDEHNRGDPRPFTHAVWHEFSTTGVRHLGFASLSAGSRAVTRGSLRHGVIVTAERC